MFTAGLTLGEEAGITLMSSGELGWLSSLYLGTSSAGTKAEGGDDNLIGIPGAGGGNGGLSPRC